MTQQMFDHRGKRIFLASDRGTERPDIPAGVWSVDFHPMMGWYLEEAPLPSRPAKLYGDVADRATRIVNTYTDRLATPGKNTGALLSGNKGSGKTMLMAEVAHASVETGYPVLLINLGHTDQSFIKFLNSITQPCAVLIDEFEKKYKEESDQNALLGLLDGINSGGKLFVLTSNKSYVSEFLMSRPSRIFYHYRYDKLDEATIVGYCEDRLIEEAKYQFENIKTLWDFSTDFSFDILQCLVEELNRYPDTSFIECLNVLNIQLNGILDRIFTTNTILFDGEDVLASAGYPVKINLVDFIDGKQRPTIPMNIPEDVFNSIKNVVGEKSLNHYNSSYFSAKEKGEEVEDNSYDEDVSLRLTFDSNNITATSDTIKGVWEVDGHSLFVILHGKNKSSSQDVYEKIFSN